MTIVLCDDQPVYLKEAEEILRDFEQKTEQSFEIRTFTDSIKLCEQSEVIPDILFLDIRMDGQDGIKTAEIVNKKWRKCRIVYLTDFLSYATDVYQTEHVYFVMKSEFQNRLPQVMEKILKDIEADEYRLTFRTGKGELVISTGEVLYFERNLRKTVIVTRDGTFEVNEKLSEIEEMLPELQFARSHHSYLISLSAIRRLGREHAEMVNGDVIQISRRYQREVKNSFAQWIIMHT